MSRRCTRTSNNRQQKQITAKRTVEKLCVDYKYKQYEKPSEDRATLRSIAEQAMAEWQFKNQHRVSNIDDHLHRKY